MKIYLTNKPKDTSEYTYITHPQQLQQSVLDKEATDIVADAFVSLFSLNEAEQLLNLIVNKMRLNGELTIIDRDADILCMQYYRGDITLAELNHKIFQFPTKSLINIELVESILDKRLEAVQKHIDTGTGAFMLKYRRVA